jgi:hypothetical protein
MREREGSRPRDPLVAESRVSLDQLKETRLEARNAFTAR